MISCAEVTALLAMCVRTVNSTLVAPAGTMTTGVVLIAAPLETDVAGDSAMS
jgi:hypothetical protein